jgi:hypothetical protein
MGDVGHICDTPDACLCSSSGEECCCLYPPDATHCEVCGATIISIDFDTGEPIASAVVARETTKPANDERGRS